MSEGDQDDRALDALLALAPTCAQPEGSCVDDGVLLQYHAGALDEATTTRIEGHLARCADCRELLQELARPVTAEAEQRAIDAVRSPARASEPGRASGSSAVLRRGPWLALAAVLIAALGTSLALLRGGASLAYQPPELYGAVREVRGEDRPAPPGATFTPDGTFKAILRPASPPPEGHDPSLEVWVRQGDGEWARASAGKVSSAEGVVRFEARAGDLLGASPGPREVRFDLRAGDATQSHVVRVSVGQ